MRIIAIIALLGIPLPAAAETLVAARTIRSQAILTAADVTSIAKSIPGTLAFADEAIGMETRVVLYSGRPTRPGDVGPPAVIERNQVVTLLFQRGGLTIVAEARSLGRAGIGDRLRLINLASRSTVTGTVQADGTVTVGGPDISKFK